MFCGNCGNQIPDGSATCPICGAPQQAAPQQQAPVNYGAAPSAGGNGGGAVGIIGLVLGILSIPFALLGGIMYGVPGSAVAVVFGAVGLVMGIMTYKATNKANGMPALICSIIGLVMGLLFLIGCAICGCSQKVSTGTCYSALGLCGGSCQASNDLKKGINNLNKYYNSIDWDW